MKTTCGDESQLLAETNGWSLDYTEGFIKGTASLRANATLTAYTMVGRDDYCLGFRAGYFKRRDRALPHAAARPEQAAAGAQAGTRGIPANMKPMASRRQTTYT